MSTARRCPGCNLLVLPEVAHHGQSAYCPRCQTRLYRGGTARFNAELAIAAAGLILFIPTVTLPLITIRLFGQMIPATLPSGAITLSTSFPGVATLILFCSVIAPLLVMSAVFSAQFSLKFRKFRLFKLSTWVLHHLKQWVMLDVFLVSLAIACFKVQEVADINVGLGLYCLITMQILFLVLLTRISVRRYWDAWQPENEHISDDLDTLCTTCHLTQEHLTHCRRCNSALHDRIPHSIQKTWAYLISASIFILPANLYPISIFMNNGKRIEDTIFSGVAELVKSGMTGIAAIIFIASIIVPIAKIISLAYILLAVQFKRNTRHLFRMRVFRAVHWIGKWSVMDLFVIAIMVTLIDRGQVLDFTPGPGAIAFAVVVVLTMLAAESLDSRLIWDNYEQRSK
ncbi:paraquat-inducible protein A [Photobacterium leiognathi]|uniref:paraquat-inducible protein A n=1 Tax=Photobacterium leiognathi TaxID=553611 RepID=UPI002739F77F|nr:paraquat-inducible protein A [Photobacterium leiognathi]